MSVSAAAGSALTVLAPSEDAWVPIPGVNGTMVCSASSLSACSAMSWPSQVAYS